MQIHDVVTILTQKLMQTGNDVSCKVHQDTIL